MRAKVVRTLQLAAVGAFVERLNLKRIMCAPVTTAMRGYFSLWNSHGGTWSLVKYVAMTLRHRVVGTALRPRSL